MQQTTYSRQLTAKRFVFLLLAVSCVLSAAPLSTRAASLSRNLTLGDSGDDVRQLQMALNANSLTRVADIGPGSPGQETGFFGEKTKDAVIRLQNLYTTEVLAPAGLSSGTGFVGSLTRNLLNNGLTTKPTSEETTTPTAFVTPTTNTTGLVEPSTLPNSTQFDERQVPGNKELFKAFLRSDAQRAGIPDDVIEQIDVSVDEQAEMSLPELTKKFQEGRSQFDDATRTPEMILDDARSVAPFKSFNKESALWKSVEPFLALFKPINTAQAAGLQSIGGFLTYRYLCTCSYTWYILLIGIPPMIGTFDYEIGTQAHLNYTMPFSRQMVGFATHIPTCVMYIYPSCVQIPSTFGLISPLVGSSF